MAVIPDVNISTRQIETAPSPHYFQSLKGENGRVLGGAISYTGNALDRIWEVHRRERERAARAHEVSVNRDAEYLNNQCENYLANSLVGHMETDPATGEQKEVKGKWSKSYAELESEKTSLPKLTEEAVREMREEQWYKDASPEVRAAAERKFVFTRDRWMRKSVEEHARLKQADAVEKMKKNVEFNLNGAAATFGSKQEVVDPRTGAKVPTYQYAAVRAGLKNFGALQGTEIENPEILDNPTARFEDLKWSRKLTDEQLAEKRDQYNDCVYQIYVNRIGALQKAGASGLALGEYSPSACLDEADKMTAALHGMKRGRKAADGSDIPVVNDEQFNAIKAETEKARQLLEGKRAATHKIGAQERAVEFKKRIEGLEDTRVFIGKTMQTREDYNKEIDDLLSNDKIDERTAEEYKSAYGKLLDRRDYLSKCVSEYERTGKGGVWTRVKDRNGNEIDVFQPDRLGNGKTETDPTIAAKYTMKDRNGNTPYFNNPASGMEELDFDLRMGNISVPFYNAQMAALRVYSDTKAKTAFVKIFGADATLFPDKDLPQYQKQGIDTAHKQLWSKNQWWAGNHNVGKNAATWKEDALKGDGGEYKVSLEQEAQICEMVLQLTAEGVDPTDAIQAYLAPTFDGWMKTDLSERLDPSKKIGGKTFRNWILESKRFGSAVGPRDREARLQARQKQAYEAK